VPKIDAQTPAEEYTPTLKAECAVT
jgi:hypothetical protein